MRKLENGEVSLQNVSKKYAKDYRASLKYGLVDSLRLAVGRPLSLSLRQSEFWALREVSFSLKPGDSLGVLGRNGSGKSTLLKLMSGLLRPDIGEIRTSGNLEKIIALNAGFKPEMTGRENIRLRASLRGFSGSLNRKIDEVVEFAEISEFIDSPIMNYSSGMMGRLGFALATAFDPDVLVIDEVLAVGDLAFRLKCYERIDALRQKCTVIFVSHSLAHISRICNKACYLSKGKLVHFGDTQEAIRLYQQDADEVSISRSKATLNPELASLSWHGLSNADVPEFAHDQMSTLSVNVGQVGSNCWMRILVNDVNESGVWDMSSRRQDVQVQAGKEYRIALPKFGLGPGLYSLYVQLQDGDGKQLCLSERLPFRVNGLYYSSVACQPSATWMST